MIEATAPEAAAVEPPRPVPAAPGRSLFGLLAAQRRFVYLVVALLSAARPPRARRR